MDSSLIAPAFLGAMFIWGQVDSHITSSHATKYVPAPPASSPTFTPEKDVSVIINTLNPPAEFGPCLVSCYMNKPLEIIVVTTKDHIRDVTNIVNQVVLTHGFKGTNVKIVESEKGARVQFKAGIEVAKGKVIAKCDDHIHWPGSFLVHMLACFEDESVGAVAPPIKIHIPEKRRCSKVITGWEVAATKHAFRTPGSATAMYAAAKWCWIIAGVSGVYRAEILKDPEFLKAYTNDSWRGVKLDCGEDTFVSRWLLARDWVIATQWCEETTVWRTVKRSPAFISQMLRWERSTLQSMLRTWWYIPQYKKNSLVKRKTIERILKAPLGLVHFIAWILSFYSHPVKTFILFAVYAYLALPGYQKFFRAFPYMKKYWWVAVLVDNSYVIIGIWAWMTLSNTTWERGEGGWKVAAAACAEDAHEN